MLVNISMTFHEDNLNVFQVTERTALYSVLDIAVFFFFFCFCFFHELSYANRAIIGHTT